MEMNKKQKIFDAVKTMRDVRDKISLETQDMNLEELKAYIKKRLSESNAKVVGHG